MPTQLAAGARTQSHEAGSDREQGGVLVVGMARSGTSALARLVNLLGFSLCAEPDLTPANDLNPLGVFESRTIRRFDQVLLARWCNAGWAQPCLPPGWHREPGVRLLHAPARRLFADVHPASRWVCKDPHFCLLLPFWLDALRPRPHVAFIYRHPAEVARSLQRSMGFDLARGLAIWERHQRAALAALDGASVTVISYDEMVCDPLAVAGTLAGWLRSEGFDVAAASETAAAESIGARQRHWRAGAEDEQLLSVQQRRLLATLEAGRGPHRSWARPEVGAETATTTELLAVRPLSAALRRPRWWWWIGELTLPVSVTGPASRVRAPRRWRRVGSIGQLRS